MDFTLEELYSDDEDLIKLGSNIAKIGTITLIAPPNTITMLIRFYFWQISILVLVLVLLVGLPSGVVVEWRVIKPLQRLIESITSFAKSPFVKAPDWKHKEDGIIEKEIISRLTEFSNKFMAERAVKFGVEVFRQAEKTLLLQVLDQGWKEHLLMLDQMRQSIGLRAYAQKDPLNEYKSEAFQLFEALLDGLRVDVTKQLSQVRPISEEEQRAMMQQMIAQQQQAAQQAQAASQTNAKSSATGFDENDRSTWGNPGRNDPCPCGSGKKFKHCHGRL